MTTAVRALADKVFAYRLEEQWFLRLRRGLPVERIRVESDEAWAQDARFAQSVLAELRTTQPVDEDDRLTAGFVEHLMASWVERVNHPLLGFTVTPYQSFFLGMSLQQVFGPFQGSGSTYLSLVGDLRDQVRELPLRLARQREAGILVPAAALPGVRESLARARAAAGAMLPASAPSEAREQVERLVAKELLPAYHAVLAALGEDYERDAPAGVGMAQYPGGAP
jgi:hypothetical protein